MGTRRAGSVSVFLSFCLLISQVGMVETFNEAAGHSDGGWLQAT